MNKYVKTGLLVFGGVFGTIGVLVGCFELISWLTEELPYALKFWFMFGIPVSLFIAIGVACSIHDDDEKKAEAESK